MQMDLLEARQARDEGMAKVTEPSWVDGALARMRWMRLLHKDGFTGEDVRVYLSIVQYTEAPHPNAWGALINTAVRRGLIEKTGEYRQMKVKSSHARATPVYRVVF